MSGEDKVVDVWVVTSPTCPYCLLAKEVLKRLEQKLGGIFRWREFNTATQEGLEVARRYGIFAVPTFIMDGEVVFEGLPPEEVLEREILERYKRKS